MSVQIEPEYAEEAYERLYTANPDTKIPDWVIKESIDVSKRHSGDYRHISLSP